MTSLTLFTYATMTSHPSVPWYTLAFLQRYDVTNSFIHATMWSQAQAFLQRKIELRPTKEDLLHHNILKSRSIITSLAPLS